MKRRLKTVLVLKNFRGIGIDPLSIGIVLLVLQSLVSDIKI